MMYKMSVSIWFSIINHNFSVSCYLENILNDSLAIILYTNLFIRLIISDGMDSA